MTALRQLCRLSLAFGILSTMTCQAGEADLQQAITTVRTASPVSATTDDVRRAWRTLAAAEPEAIPNILRGMDGGNLAAENWLRSAVDAIVDRIGQDDARLPTAGLRDLVSDTSAAPRARRVAYELLGEADPESAGVMLARMIDDPSLEIRYDAIQTRIEALGDHDDSEALESYRQLFQAARDLDQIKACKEKLEAAGDEIDLARHLGFVTSWRLCGVFDNSDQAGFDVAYPPESEIDFAATYDGKTESATWLDEPVTTDDQLGVVHLNDAIGPKKGAVAYAFAEFNSPRQQAAQIRYASKNATKLWLNDRLVAANEVYHAGGGFDQYIIDVQLTEGRNTLLLKVCQNEQTEPWAQDWDFQLRISDELGGAVELDTTEMP